MIHKNNVMPKTVLILRVTNDLKTMRGKIIIVINWLDPDTDWLHLPLLAMSEHAAIISYSKTLFGNRCRGTHDLSMHKWLWFMSIVHCSIQFPTSKKSVHSFCVGALGEMWRFIWLMMVNSWKEINMSYMLPSCNLNVHA